MRVLTRYILFDLIKVIVLVLASMTTVIILGFVAKEAVDEGLGPAAVMRIVPYVLPEAMRFAVPGAVLLAVTTLYGRMAASNEIVALKSLGISPMSILWPMIALAALVSFGTVWLNDFAVSWGRIGMQRVVLESLEEIVYGRLKSHRTFSASGTTIHVQGVEGKDLIQPVLTIKTSASSRPVTVTAQTARLHADLEAGTVVLELTDADGDIGNGWGGTWPGVYKAVISVDDLTRNKPQPLNPSNCPLARIPAAIEGKSAEISQTRQEMAATAAYQLVTGDFDGLSGADFRAQQEKLAHATSHLTRLRTEPHRRWANGFCCLSFALVGAPIAIRRRQSEVLASFFACFLPILGLFYPMLFLGIRWAKDGVIPPAGVWTGNVVFAIWGLWLLRRMLRH